MQQDETFGIAILLIAAAIGLVMLGLYIWSLVWCYGDAEKRGKPGCLVVILIALIGWPLGLLLWVVVRPEDDRRISRH